MAPHAFDTILCAECGEVTVERYARLKRGKIVCQPCAKKSRGAFVVKAHEEITKRPA